MHRLEVSGAVRPLQWSLGVKGLSNVSNRVVEKSNHKFYVQTRFRENRAVHDIMWKKKKGRAGQATDDNIISRKRFACWITKATETH